MIPILITLSALTHLAAGYAVNAGYWGLLEHLHPGGIRTPWDWPCVIANMIVGPLGFIVLALFWWEYGRQPFRWDWPGLLINEGDKS